MTLKEFSKQNTFFTDSCRFFIPNILEQLEFKSEKKYWVLKTCRKKQKFGSLVINLYGIYDFAELSRNGESGGSKSNAIVVDYHPLTQWSEFHQSCRRHTGQCTLSEICISNPIFKCDDLASRTFKVNIVHEPCAKCFEVHILKFEILQNI